MALIGFNLLYFIIFVLRNISSHDLLFVCRSNYLTPNFILCNFGFGGHLWFIRALLYIEILLLFTERYIYKISFIPVLAVIWIADVIFCKYSQVIFGFAISSSLREMLSKFIGVAILYYFLGREIKKHDSLLRKIPDKAKIYFVIAIVGTAVLNLLEYYLLSKNGINLMPANYITTFVLVIFVMVMVIRFSNIGSETLIERIGNSHSENIYYYHPMIMYGLEFVTIVVGGIVTFNRVIIVNPIVIYSLTLFFSCGLKLLKIKFMEEK